MLEQVDVDRLATILAGKAAPPVEEERLSHVYCPECGFQNPEAANYCAKCGALLVRDEAGSDTTMSFTPEEGEDEGAAIIDEIKTEGPALVVRSGGGRAGEHFLLENDSTTVGRSPDCDVFLDDVTVSRRHAVLVAATASS